MQAMFPIQADTQITGLILAGGRARRLDGQDKGLIQLANRPLVGHVIDKLQPQTATILINANRNLSVYKEFGYPVVADSLPDFAGPLAGLLAGLHNINTDWLVSVPCDNPHLPDSLVASLVEVANEKQCRLTVASSENQLQPVYCLIHRSLQASLADYLASGQHKVRDWIANQQHSIAEFSEPREFENINTPEQLAEAQRQ